MSRSESPQDVSVVLVTAPDDAVAARIARALVDERLAACVSLVPGVRSVYRWEGAVEDATEVLLIAKTAAARVEALARRVSEIHPYDLPETLALPASGGSDAYLAWVRAESTNR
ncbi:MAG: divalent-cation tolerance protein CutA [Myxococcota bacterium]|nr:divalent-cation tolerance protein CutA [Myxococcales bacterium]